MEFPCYATLSLYDDILNVLPDEKAAEQNLRDARHEGRVVPVHEAAGAECPTCGDFLGYHHEQQDELETRWSLVCPSCLGTGVALRDEADRSTQILEWYRSRFVALSSQDRTTFLQGLHFKIYSDLERIRHHRDRGGKGPTADFRYVCINNTMLRLGDMDDILEIQRALRSNRLVLDENQHGQVIPLEENPDEEEEMEWVEYPFCVLCSGDADHHGLYEAHIVAKGFLCSNCDPHVSVFGQRLGVLVVHPPRVRVPVDGSVYEGRFENLEGTTAHVALDDGRTVFVPLEDLQPC